MLHLDDGLEFERKSFGALFGTHDQKEAMSAFLEKRKATFTDTIDDFFNLDKFPWKNDTGSDRRDRRIIPESPFREGDRVKPGMVIPSAKGIPGMELFGAAGEIFMENSRSIMQEWYEMQKMSTAIVQRQNELVMGGLMDFSKFIPKWMK